MKIKDYNTLPHIHQEIIDGINKSDYDYVFEKLKQIKEPIDFWSFRCHHDSYYLSNPLYFLINPHFKIEQYDLIFEKFSANLFTETISDLSEDDKNIILNRCNEENKNIPYDLEKDYFSYNDAIFKMILSISELNHYHFKNIYMRTNNEMFEAVYHFIDKTINSSLVTPSFELINELLDNYTFSKLLSNNSFSTEQFIKIFDLLVAKDKSLEKHLQYSFYALIEYKFNNETPDRLNKLMNHQIIKGFVPELKFIPKNEDDFSYFNHYFDIVVKTKQFEKLENILLNPEGIEYTPYMFVILMQQYINEKKKDNRVTIKKALDYILEKGVNIDNKYQENIYSSGENINDAFRYSIAGGYFKNKTQKDSQNEMISFYNENKLLLGKNYILNNLPVIKHEPSVVKKKRI